ncbi:hypothetical protein PR048_009443 [Dryococelus australis]|uniref:Uncharacterized protein n=1 Tax=Dryococelus australis TaxID=614101 RepID=A0ABQ9HZZ4_9NEOP|nr:hypothetical protein PR048_009443 [Dryococelus australis]
MKINKKQQPRFKTLTRNIQREASLTPWQIVLCQAREVQDPKRKIWGNCSAFSKQDDSHSGNELVKGKNIFPLSAGIKDFTTAVKQQVGCGAAVSERLACWPLTKANRVQSRMGHFQSFTCGNCAGRCRWLAGFLGDFQFPPSLYSGAAPFSPRSHSSALKTSFLNELQVNNLGHVHSRAVELRTPAVLVKWRYGRPNTIRKKQDVSTFDRGQITEASRMGHAISHVVQALEPVSRVRREFKSSVKTPAARSNCHGVQCIINSGRHWLARLVTLDRQTTTQHHSLIQRWTTATCVQPCLLELSPSYESPHHYPLPRPRAAKQRLAEPTPREPPRVDAQKQKSCGSRGAILTHLAACRKPLDEVCKQQAGLKMPRHVV